MQYMYIQFNSIYCTNVAYCKIVPIVPKLTNNFKLLHEIFSNFINNYLTIIITLFKFEINLKCIHTIYIYI